MSVVALPFTRTTTRETARIAVLGALAAVLLFHVSVLVYHLALTMAFPYELNYGEGYVLNDAVRLAHGQAIYVDLQQFPMVRSPYPPLFPWLWSLVVPLAGAGLWPGRVLEIGSLAAIVALIGINAWRTRGGIWPVVAAVGLVLASPFVYQWAGYARVDLLALLFAVGGVVAAQWIRGLRGVVLAAFLCALGLWTKQTAITATAAVAVALMLRSWRDGALFVALVSAPSLAFGAILDAQTQGEFVRHVLLGNASNPVLPARAVIYVGTFAFLNLIALAGVVWWLRRALGGRPSPVALYVPIALLAAFSAGNGGSSVNYLIEPVLALALAVPFVWRAVPPASATALPLFALIQLLLLAHWPNGFGTTYLAESAIGRTPTAEDASVGSQVDQIVRGTRGEVMVEAASFAIRNDRPVYIQPIDLRAEQLQGRWQPAPLVDALSSGRFARVITTYNLFPAAAEQALGQHFTLSQTLSSPDGLTFRVYDFHS